MWASRTTTAGTRAAASASADVVSKRAYSVASSRLVSARFPAAAAATASPAPVLLLGSSAAHDPIRNSAAHLLRLCSGARHAFTTSESVPSFDDVEPEQAEREPSASLFIQNIPFEATLDDIESLMSQYATVDRVSLVWRERDVSHRGRGIVRFASVAEATRVRDEASEPGIQLQGRTLYMDYALPFAPRDPSWVPASERELSQDQLYVRNLPTSVTRRQVQQLFEAHGEVVRVAIPLLDKGQELDEGENLFAYVHFAQAEGAQKAVKALDGTFFKGTQISVNPAPVGRKRTGDGFGGGGGRGGYGASRGRGGRGGFGGGRGGRQDDRLSGENGGEGRRSGGYRARFGNDRDRDGERSFQRGYRRSERRSY